MIWLLPNVVNKKIQGIINCQGGIISSLNFFYRCVGVCVCGHVSVEWTFFSIRMSSLALKQDTFSSGHARWLVDGSV
jgi:hypothetical protein